MSRALCIIPARGGSKRLPRKNVRPLGGRPLIAWTVQTALDAGVFDTVVLSTEDDEIVQAASGLDVEVHRRDPALATDTATVFQVVAGYLENEGRGRCDVIAAMLPTCPFCAPQDVAGAMALYRRHGARATAMTVSEYDFPPQFGMDLGQDGTLAMRHPEVYARTTRSQGLGKIYHPNGACWITSVEKYLEHGTFYAGTMVGSVMPRERAVDINEPADFMIAEAMLAAREGS